jgi:aminoglycoside phosphotransferase (APT) family kinase protein
MLPGEPLVDILAREGIRTQDIADAIQDAGRLLGMIHSVPTGGFGLIDGTGNATNASWESFVERFDEPRLATLASDAGLDAGLVGSALDRLLAGARVHKASTPGLLHGDFAPKHVLVKDGRVTGVIDFEFARSGYPAADLAFWRYAEPESFELLLRGYGEIADPASLLLHSLDISLSYIDHHGPRGELSGEFRDLVVRRLSEDLAGG